MRNIEFVWNNFKAAASEKRHGVSFVEAQSVFCDENALHMSDPDHSTDEDRFVLLGMSSRLRLLVVCHCFRYSESQIRIISARKATKAERRQYMEAL